MKPSKFFKSSLNALSLCSISLVCIVGCVSKQPIELTSSDFQSSVDHITDIMVHDIFSPPVASRIYAYPNIAAYEILAQNDSNMRSLTQAIEHLKPIPVAQDTTLNYPLAALIAHIDVSKALVFSEERVAQYRDSLYQL